MANYGFNEEEWANLYLLLRNRVARWVGRSRVPMWNSRRDLIVEDIVSEAILKMITYAQRAECGEVRMIDSLESISSVTAYHCYIDALRRDRHLQPFMPEFEEPIGPSASSGDVDPSEVAIDNIDYELLFIHVARWIAILPDKQRTALLIDLANRMYIDPFEATPLQEALARAGIAIRDYQQPLPIDKQARARHAAHLCLAYKRLASLVYMQRYTLVA